MDAFFNGKWGTREMVENEKTIGFGNRSYAKTCAYKAVRGEYQVPNQFQTMLKN